MTPHERYILECTYIPPDESDFEEKDEEFGFTEYDDYLYDQYVENNLDKELEEKIDGRKDISISP